MERWRQIESLFHEALRRDPAERDAWLREACHGDSGLQREVASLLVNHHEAGDFEPWVAAAAAQLIDSRVSLEPGQCLGPYRIECFLAAGGMGEVYRATDTRLNRPVAIKVSAERFTARFEREARVIASLNHPNICTLYDVGPNYLVMEYVEGPTMAERIHQGPVALAEVLEIVRQMAAALEEAHQRLVVHRDFKPGNVQIKSDGTVKVLDFGLAKLTAVQAGASANATESPTLTIAATQPGVLLGTAAYMSPEQARGEPVDRRGDVWAFGVVLCEMLTGKRLFQGKTTSDVLAAVIRDEPDLSLAPAKVRPLLKRCLEKDPQRRLRDIGDAMGIIESTAETLPASSRVVWALAAVGVVFALAFAAMSFVHLRETSPLAELMRFQFPGPEANASFPSRPILSPNGRVIAFSARGPAGHNILWVRWLDSPEARALTGTEEAGISSLFWSPDSRFIGFGAPGKLKKVAVSGGSPQTLCDLTGLLRGGAWSRTGVIIFGSEGHGLMRVSESGGAPSPLTALDPSRESSHSAPAFLPDGRHFVYRRNSGSERNGLYLGSLDLRPEQQGSKLLVATESNAVYAPSGDPALGYLLFVSDVREGSLIAQPFDNRRMELSGEAVPIAEDLRDGAMFSASENGILAYRTGSSFPSTQLRWFERTGKMLGAVGEMGRTDTVALSPDGTRVAYSYGSGGAMDIWVYEFAHGTSQRLTFDSANHWMAVWSPDGSRLAFASKGTGIYDIYQKASSGVGSEDLLLKSGEMKFPYDWSPNGRWLLYGSLTGQVDLWVLPLLGGERRPVRYLASQSNKSQARFSPDGRFIAYTSTESGKNEVYVQPFPEASGGKWVVSKGGGNQPHWRRDGKELFYISVDSKMMTVDVTTTPVFRNGNPKVLFAAPILGSASAMNVTRYDVTPDGQKFLIDALAADAAAPNSPITVVLNWQIGLKK